MIQKDKIDEAKQVNLLHYLSRKGFEPVRASHGSRFAFCSPFRTETNPSFYVDVKSNTYKDFGLDEKGGDIIQLAKKFNNEDFGKAILDILDTTQTKGFYAYNQEPKEPIKQGGKILISEVQPLQSLSLINYVESRAIRLQTALKYLQEVVYFNGSERKYFSIGFKNDSGGFELRNRIKDKEIKLCSSKDITTIEVQGSTTINVFEGFFSFLSALEYYQTDRPKNTTIVLNSLSLVNRIAKQLEQAQRVNLYLDNDGPGAKAASKIMAAYPQAKDCSKVYTGYKDFNEFINYSA